MENKVSTEILSNLRPAWAEILTKFQHRPNFLLSNHTIINDDISTNIEQLLDVRTLPKLCFERIRPRGGASEQK